MSSLEGGVARQSPKATGSPVEDVIRRLRKEQGAFLVPSPGKRKPRDGTYGFWEEEEHHERSEAHQPQDFPHRPSPALGDDGKAADHRAHRWRQEGGRDPETEVDGKLVFLVLLMREGRQTGSKVPDKRRSGSTNHVRQSCTSRCDDRRGENSSQKSQNGQSGKTAQQRESLV